MIKFALPLLLGIVFSGYSFGQLAPTAKAKKDAARLWEQIVEVRGGHQKLELVSNLLVTIGDKPDNTRIQLFVFPQKYWEWDKDKKFHDFMFVTMSNIDYGLFMVAAYEGVLTDRRFEQKVGGANYREGWLMDACAFLLETKWAKPTPINLRSEWVGKERFDVIETVFPEFSKYRNWGLEYYVEPETLAVRHVAYLNEKQRRYNVRHFSGITKVDGISVPSTFGESAGFEKTDQWSKSSMTPISFQFNVDYNPQLFELPPSVAAGPDAWKRKL